MESHRVYTVQLVELQKILQRRNANGEKRDQRFLILILEWKGSSVHMD